jgi:hypothetical protein
MHISTSHSVVVAVMLHHLSPGILANIKLPSNFMVRPTRYDTLDVRTEMEKLCANKVKNYPPISLDHIRDVKRLTSIGALCRLRQIFRDDFMHHRTA